MKKAKRGAVKAGSGRTRKSQRNRAFAITNGRYVLLGLGELRTDPRQKTGVPHYYAMLRERNKYRPSL